MATDDGNRDGDPLLRIALPVRGGKPGGGGHLPPDQLDLPKPDGVGAPHGGVGYHDMVCLQQVVDRIGVFKRLNLGVDGGGIWGPGGAHTGLVPVPD